MCIVQLIVMYVIPVVIRGNFNVWQQQLQKIFEKPHHVHACTLRKCTARAHARVRARVHRVSRYQVVWHQSIGRAGRLAIGAQVKCWQPHAYIAVAANAPPYRHCYLTALCQ